jgi:ribosomal protein S6
MAGRRYETLVLIHPDQGEAGAKDVTARIKSLIEDQQGTISQILEWGMRELAYRAVRISCGRRAPARDRA